MVCFAFSVLYIPFLFQSILKQLTDMGFKETRAKKALILNRLVNLWSWNNKSIIVVNEVQSCMSQGDLKSCQISVACNSQGQI